MKNKLVVITDSYGLDTDGLDFNRYHNIIFSYHVTMQCFKLGKRFNLSFPITKQTKRGVTCLLLCSRPFKVDMTTCVNVSANPGPDCVGKSSGHITNWRPCCAWRPSCLDDFSSDKIKYSKQQLIGYKSKLPISKGIGILKTRRVLERVAFSMPLHLLGPSIACHL